MKTEINIMQVRNNLISKRKACGFTQEDAAERLGCSKKTISNYERHPENLDIEQLSKLGNLYNCHPQEFFVGS